ncbi:hypothetical protein CMV_018702 [Castanea mollissima]|uniref:Uncharacterized protein n=1 Tax=Castanea mollissima TaxID=60419 RepID=A0A8J4R2Y5_9ROSI|nr:hypothetical protein CMV_018702 [Castanea mollissima]
MKVFKSCFQSLSEENHKLEVCMKVLCLRAYEPDKTVQVLSSFSKQAILGPSFNFVNFITDPNPSITVPVTEMGPP